MDAGQQLGAQGDCRFPTINAGVLQVGFRASESPLPLQSTRNSEKPDCGIVMCGPTLRTPPSSTVRLSGSVPEQDFLLTLFSNKKPSLSPIRAPTNAFGVLDPALSFIFFETQALSLERSRSSLLCYVDDSHPAPAGTMSGSFSRSESTIW